MCIRDRSVTASPSSTSDNALNSPVTVHTPAMATSSKFEIPSTSKSALTSTLAEKVEIPDAVTLSTSAVPSKYKCLHCCEELPKSYASSPVGTKLEANSPPTTISSLVESPSLTVPPRNVAIPINSDCPPTYNLSVTESAAPT